MGWIILAIVVILVIAIISMYNGLVSSRVKVDNAWSQIDVQLQRRFDLIPNFVETVKGYAAHESETFEKITSLRTSWANANTVADYCPTNRYGLPDDDNHSNKHAVPTDKDRALCPNKHNQYCNPESVPTSDN